MTAVDETTTPRLAVPLYEVYETYAEIETAQGNDAWNAGNYHRATKLWCSAARWAQFAAKAATGGATR